MKTHLTLPPNLPQIHQHILPTLQITLPQPLPQRPRRLPRIIIRDLVIHVVRDVCLCDAVEDVGADGAEGGAADGAEGAVVREEGFRKIFQASCLATVQSIIRVIHWDRSMLCWLSLMVWRHATFPTYLVQQSARSVDPTLERPGEAVR